MWREQPFPPQFYRDLAGCGRPRFAEPFRASRYGESTDMKVWHSRSMLLTCTAALALVQALPVQAQTSAQVEAQSAEDSEEAQPQSSGANYLSPIVVQGATGTDPYVTPGPVSTITPDEIEQFGGKNIDDVLRATPGTFTRDNVQNPGVAVNIRGLEGSGRVNMMIDGVRQNFRFTGHEAQG